MNFVRSIDSAFGVPKQEPNAQLTGSPEALAQYILGCSKEHYRLAWQEDRWTELPVQIQQNNLDQINSGLGGTPINSCFSVYVCDSLWGEYRAGGDKWRDQT